MNSSRPSPPTPPSRRAPREDRRRQIVEATLQLIAEGGVDAVTHRRVAAAAGVPLGSTTYYFESREHLIREAFAWHLAAAQQPLDARSPQQATSAEALLDFIVTVTMDEIEARDRLLAEFELTLFAARDAELATILHAFDAAVTARLAEALGALGAQAPEDAGRTILQLIRGYQLDQLSLPAVDRDAFRRRLAVVLAAFLAPRP